VLYSGHKNVDSHFLDTDFNNTFALFGGVFYSEFGGQLRCTRCNIKYSSAILAAVAYLTLGSNFTFSSVVMDFNYSIKYQILFLSSSSPKESFCYFCDINSNIIYDNITSLLYAKVLSQPTYTSIIDSYTPSSTLIKTISSTLTISTSRTINQNTVISWLDSILTLTTFEFFSSTASPSIVSAYGSTVTVSNTTLRNIQLTSNVYLIDARESTLTVKDTNFSVVEVPIVRWQDGELHLQNMAWTSQTSRRYLQESSNTEGIVKIKGWLATLDGVQITNAIVTGIEEIFYVYAGSQVTVNGGTFQGINVRLFTVTDSQITLSDTTITSTSLIGGNTPETGTAVTAFNSDIKAENSVFNALNATVSGGAIYSSQDLIERRRSAKKIEIINCNFTSNVASFYGGAIYSENNDVSITGGNYDTNSANIGGAMYLSWSVSALPEWTYTFNGFSASNNKAAESGGVVYTDMYKPTISGLTLSGNSANYGPDFSSYPITISLNTTTSPLKVVSGQSTESLLTFIAYDFFDQVAVSLKNRLAGLEINSTEIQVTSQTRASSLNGIFSFSESIIIGFPGTSGYLTFLTSSLDLDKHNKYYSTNILEFKITIPFEIRFCARGEAQERQICVVCPQTTYSLFENSTRCLDCPDNAYWPGGDQIIVDKGYWRASIDTDVVFGCLNQNGCLGGMYSEWKTGYYGRLWN
jgi:predicted outer membrane repeat protein